MAAFTHTLSDGLKLQVQLKRSAKKNIILRPVSAEAISVNAPPFLSLPKLAACGMRIPLDWAHKKMQIPQAEPDEPQLVAATSASKPPADKGEG